MSEARLRELALRFVPGSGEAHLQPLRAGLVNRSYRVVRDARSFVLRLERAAAAPGVDRAWECRVLRLAAAAGLAPAPVSRCALGVNRSGPPRGWGRCVDDWCRCLESRLYGGGLASGREVPPQCPAFAGIRPVVD